MIKKNGFTLIELAVAAIIIGILVLIGIPNLLKSTQRGYSLDAMRNLMAIYAAQQSWSQENGGSFYSCSSLDDSSEGAGDGCNAKLGLNIVSVGGTRYQCGISNFYCKAFGANSTFTMSINLNKAVTIKSAPVYDTLLGSNNPFCEIPGGSSYTAGSLCP